MAAASGGEVPQALKEQLAPGGRLVIPVGNQAGYQHLIKIVRRGDSRYDEEHLADVRFVPLVSGQTRPDPAA